MMNLGGPEMRPSANATRQRALDLKSERTDDKPPDALVGAYHRNCHRPFGVRCNVSAAAGFGTELMKAFFVFIPDRGGSDGAGEKNGRRDVEQEKECQGEKHAFITLHS